MNGKQFRTLVRLLHLLEGAAIALFVYSPLGADPAYRALVQWVIVPAVAMSGIMLWQQPRVLRLLRVRTG